jgi:hypothetical protein
MIKEGVEFELFVRFNSEFRQKHKTSPHTAEEIIKLQKIPR